MPKTDHDWLKPDMSAAELRDLYHQPGQRRRRDEKKPKKTRGAETKQTIHPGSARSAEPR